MKNKLNNRSPSLAIVMNPPIQEIADNSTRVDTNTHEMRTIQDLIEASEQFRSFDEYNKDFQWSSNFDLKDFDTQRLIKSKNKLEQKQETFSRNHNIERTQTTSGLNRFLVKKQQPIKQIQSDRLQIESTVIVQFQPQTIVSQMINNHQSQVLPAVNNKNSSSIQQIQGDIIKINNLMNQNSFNPISPKLQKQLTSKPDQRKINNLQNNNQLQGGSNLNNILQEIRTKIISKRGRNSFGNPVQQKPKSNYVNKNLLIQRQQVSNQQDMESHSSLFKYNDQQRQQVPFRNTRFSAFLLNKMKEQEQTNVKDNSLQELQLNNQEQVLGLPLYHNSSSAISSSKKSKLLSKRQQQQQQDCLSFQEKQQSILKKIDLLSNPNFTSVVSNTKTLIVDQGGSFQQRWMKNYCQKAQNIIKKRID